MNAVLRRSIPLPAWTWRLPEAPRWPLAAALWLIPLAAVALQGALVPESLPLLTSWISADPTLLAAALLVVATEAMSVLVVCYQLGSRELSLARFALPPILLACLPLALWTWQLEDHRLLVTDGVPLMSRHLFTLFTLFYGGFALLSLRGLLHSDAPVIRVAEGDPVPDAPAIA